MPVLERDREMLTPSLDTDSKLRGSLLESVDHPLAYLSRNSIALPCRVGLRVHQSNVSHWKKHTGYV